MHNANNKRWANYKLVIFLKDYVSINLSNNKAREGYTYLFHIQR